MNSIADRKHADEWDSWADDDVWMIGPEPTEEDATWASEHLNDDYHDLDGKPDEDIAEVDPWTSGDDYEADGGFDARAGESAYLDAHEQGRKTF